MKNCKTFTYAIGDKIRVKATLHKASNFFEEYLGEYPSYNRERFSKPCEKVGYVTGIQKKLIKWNIKNNTSYSWDGIPESDPNTVKDTVRDYVVSFRERMAGKEQEALLADIELLK